MFVDIFRKGRHLGGDGRPVYPPMPWHYLRYLPDEDLRAIFTYLRSIPPVRNDPPALDMPPPVEELVLGINNKIIALQADPAAKIDPPAHPPPGEPLKLPPVRKGVGPDRKYPPELLARGKRSVMAGLCNDCHTPWVHDQRFGVAVPDWSRMLSGHPEGAPDPRGQLGKDDMWLIGPTFTSHRFPFGVTYSMNLTPDLETGIGKWTEEQFLAMFRQARHADGRTVFPPMPWTMIRNLPDDDLRAIFAYLQSVPPIHNRVPRRKVEPADERKMEQINARLLLRTPPGVPAPHP
jgi:hypothetical protein